MVMSPSWLCFCCITEQPPPRRPRIDRSMIGEPMNFQHTGHIGSGEVQISVDRCRKNIRDLDNRRWANIDLGNELKIMNNDWCRQYIMPEHFIMNLNDENLAINDVTYRMKSKGGYQDHSVDSRLTPNGIEIKESKTGQD